MSQLGLVFIMWVMSIYYILVAQLNSVVEVLCVVLQSLWVVLPQSINVTEAVARLGFICRVTNRHGNLQRFPARCTKQTPSTHRTTMLQSAPPLMACLLQKYNTLQSLFPI